MQLFEQFISSKRIAEYTAYIVLLFAIYFAVFHYLDVLPIILFDEGSYSNNALEMTMNNNFMVLHYDNEPTLYNTKPPFVIWMQSLFMRVIGMNELAVRLPSAFSALFLIVSMLVFSKKVLKKPLIGIAGSFALLGTLGYVRTHVVRSGDLDGMLTWWVCFYSLVFFSYLLKKNANFNKYITLTSLGVLFAFFSKSVAGFIPILALFLLALFSEKRKEIFKNKYLYINSILVLAACLSYYFFRENQSSGYIEKVLFSEYSRAYTSVMDWHKRPFWFYWDIFIKLDHFTPYIYFIPAAVSLGLFSDEKIIKRATVYFSTWCFIYFMVISYPPNKLDWYDAPLFPFLCMLFGIFTYEFFKGLKKIIFSRNRRIAVQFLFCCSMFIYPYYRVVNQNFERTKKVNKLEREGQLIRYLTKNHPEIVKYKVLMDTRDLHHTDAAKFYIKSSNFEKGRDINLIQYLSEFEVSDKVLICQKNKIDSVKVNYHHEMVFKQGNCELLEIKMQKSAISSF